MTEAISMYDYQIDAIKRMHSGCILCGDVGSGKSRTALAFYHLFNGGTLDPFSKITTKLNDKLSDTSVLYASILTQNPLKNLFSLYIITTARKRDTNEWIDELSTFELDPQHEPPVNIVIDSWNNIQKYKDVENAFFIFDEQRVVGSGAWVKSFLKIAKSNVWILLSATPGDTWSDYIPVFIANGFYRNKTEFTREHIVYSQYAKFPKIDRYLNTGRLIRLRNSILVDMDFHHEVEKHHEFIRTEYDKELYKDIMKNRTLNNKPIESASELCYALRRIPAESPERAEVVKKIVDERGRAIIFYNFDYERDILLSIDWGCPLAEWNGHKHQPIPDSSKWVYLVQYTAGAEGWNCILTNTVIFFSLNYSYKIMHQASGRIDRLNTKYTDLYYFYLTSYSPIDLAIRRALHNKKKFNETSFVKNGENYV